MPELPEEVQRRLSIWFAQQISSLGRLQGRSIGRWAGIEMAVREQGLDGRPQWHDESVPMLQFCRLTLVLADGMTATLGTAQSDTRWGLCCSYDSGPISPFQPDFEGPDVPESTSIFRHRVLAELPSGEVRNVIINRDDAGDISEVEIDVEGRVVLSRAGEIYENGDGTLTVHDMDESILVQVDGSRPGQARAILKEKPRIFVGSTSPGSASPKE